MRAQLEQALAAALAADETGRLAYVFACHCARRVRHLLEDEALLACLDALQAFVDGQLAADELAAAAAEAARLARRHPGSPSLDGVGHAAVSASHAVANALAGRAAVAADYAAYAMVYGGGGYGATTDPAAFDPEYAWQLACLRELESTGI